jgi:hypothetical protein
VEVSKYEEVLNPPQISSLVVDLVDQTLSLSPVQQMSSLAKRSTAARLGWFEHFAKESQGL